ncbi:MAG: hypothetical protein GXP55_04295 [Deltaproteobacteria bacterium]|nr:hypothetical protein [Deltaproteobacteria bacterium]
MYSKIRLTAAALGLFVVYPACAGVQRESSTRATAYGSAGVTRKTRFDCEGDPVSRVTHRQLGAGGEVVRQTEGALGGGVSAQAVGGDVTGTWGDVEVDPRRSPYLLGNVGGFVSLDYEWVGHEIGLGFTFRLDRARTPIPTPWYTLRLGRYDGAFFEFSAGDRYGFLLSENVLGVGMGWRFPKGMMRLGLRWGGRMVIDQELSYADGLSLAVDQDGGDVATYFELRVDVSERVGLFGAFEVGTQPVAARFGLSVRLDPISKPAR